MKIIGEGPEGSLVAEVDEADGMIHIGMRNAPELAAAHGKVVCFIWNAVPLAVAADSDTDLIMRAWQARKPGDENQIGPYPDPASTPEYRHGTSIVRITV